jgi:hypothetical protein
VSVRPCRSNPNAEADERVRPEGVGQRHIGGAAPAGDHLFVPRKFSGSALKDLAMIQLDVIQLDVIEGRARRVVRSQRADWRAARRLEPFVKPTPLF